MESRLVNFLVDNSGGLIQTRTQAQTVLSVFALLFTIACVAYFMAPSVVHGPHAPDGTQVKAGVAKMRASR